MRIFLLRLFVILILVNCQLNLVAQTWAPGHSIRSSTDSYNFNSSQVPSSIVEGIAPAASSSGLSYQWQVSYSPEGGWSNFPGATSSSFTFSTPLTQTMYYRRITTNSSSQSIASNIVKYKLVSADWENRNYVREIAVNVSGVTSLAALSSVSQGDKIQVTKYFDALGRTNQVVAREVSAPQDGSNNWKDFVQFNTYDALGRTVERQLPYVTSTQLGMFKTTPVSEQQAYYVAKYSDYTPKSTLTYDNSPLNRVVNGKAAGDVWNASSGKSVNFVPNQSSENIVIWNLDVSGGGYAPLSNGYYGDGLLNRIESTDDAGSTVVQYYGKTGLLLLKKVKMVSSPSGPYSGWNSTYYVYDDFGQLVFELTPKAVEYLAANSWSFSGTSGSTVLTELCNTYKYDEKGRLTYKREQGSNPKAMVYDKRDRLVFAQDGRMAAGTAKWLATLYDPLDRSLASLVYTTSKTASQLRTDVEGASATSAISITSSNNNGGLSSLALLCSYPAVTSTDLNNTSVTNILSYNFYDSYVLSITTGFSSGYTNDDAYASSGTNMVPITAQSNQLLGVTTHTRTRVLGSNTFLAGTYYYDRWYHPIQSINTNFLFGQDIVTTQYRFDDRVMSEDHQHTASGTSYSGYHVLTRLAYDKIGRLFSVEKRFGSSGSFKLTSSINYDELGRLKTKHLAPGSVSGLDLESLEYSYNIMNQLTGINKDYALKSGSYSKWSHYFGNYIEYENKTSLFSSSRLNGQARGEVWNTQGDDAQRQLEYQYDAALRFGKASFKQREHVSDSWSNSTLDYTVTGVSGALIDYDANGNIQHLEQKGTVPGESPFFVDRLSYQYKTLSNQLSNVGDNPSIPALNGLLEDFKDGSNTTTDDFSYDENGNAYKNQNKGIDNNITYNIFNKPEHIEVTGKGVIDMTYDAAGTLLKRSFTPTSSTAISAIYLGEFVYTQTSSATKLDYIMFEEGRLRLIEPTSLDNGYDRYTLVGSISMPDSRQGVFDYFIRDQRESVRMIVTDEVGGSSTIATMENSRSNPEEDLFGQPGSSNEVSTTRVKVPSGWTGNTSASVSRLGKNAGPMLGPNSLQKVMAGDKVSATVNYYFDQTPNQFASSFLPTVAKSIVNTLGVGNFGQVVQNEAGNIEPQVSGSPVLQPWLEPSGSTATTPHAYLTVIFFDERFNAIPSADGGVYQTRVAGSVGSSGSTLGLLNIKAPKNGYMYAFISNISDENVYFDDFQVAMTSSALLEENHYYPFGGRIAGISSRRQVTTYQAKTQNGFGFQGSFSETDDITNLGDFFLRTYDPQIGRWMQQDPFSQFFSPYTGMGNDPVNGTDPSGGDWLPIRNLGTILQAGSQGSAIAQGSVALAGMSKLSFISSIGISAGKLFTTLSTMSSTSSTTAGTYMSARETSFGESGYSFASYTDDEASTLNGAYQGWQPLTKDILQAYFAVRYPLESSGKLQDRIGTTFEIAWHKVAGRLLADDNYLPNDAAQTGGTRTTVPDGIADGWIRQWFGEDIRVAKASWFEVKAMNGNLYNSTSTGQVVGHLTNLAVSLPYEYFDYGSAHASAASLSFVTTSNVEISKSVMAKAASLNIMIYQYKAEYMMTTGGYMTIRFVMSNANGIAVPHSSLITSRVVIY